MTYNISMKWIIYMTTDLETGKIYIGQHRLQNEDTYDPWYFGGGETIRAIAKARRSTLCRDTLAECDCQNDADILEQFFIDVYQAQSPLIGYNRASGGQKTHLNNFEWLRKNCPQRYEILINKMREHCQTVGLQTRFQKGHQPSKETIEKIKLHSPRTRKPLSEETKQKIGNANRGRILSERQRLRRSKPVRNVTTGEVFPSLSLGAQSRGVGGAALCRHLKGGSSTCDGCMWEYI